MLNSIIIISTFILFSIIIPKSRNDNENDKYLSLDTSTILRGIAILLVIFQHFGGSFGTNLLTPLGGTGVAIFLVLSGFVHIPEHTRSLSGSLLGYKTIP